MKIKHVVVLTALAFSACQTTENGPQIKGDFAAKARDFINLVEPSFRPAAAGACGLAISLATSGQDQIDMRNDIYTISSIVAAWDGQSAAQLNASILAALPNAPEYRTVAASISGLAAVALPFIKGDPRLLVKITADLAAGCADATKP